VDASHSLVGSTIGDFVGSGPSGGWPPGGVTALSNGNYVVCSPNWNAGRGAATWGNGTTGISGSVGASNSLVGSNPGDLVSGALPGEILVGVTALRNGNYVVTSPDWNSFRGAATWGNGTIGVRGTIDASNSLVGTANDEVGYRVVALSNGNYVVASLAWNGARGATTWGDGTIGITGTVDASNSLVGSNPNDDVGLYVTALSNGNYVVGSPWWNGNRGAATWGAGTSGVRGTVDASNSLVGSTANDGVATSIKALSNGNYVVNSFYWNGKRGAVTWGGGTTGVTGTVGASNSLVGGNPNDQVGSNDVTVLTNGNYVVNSPSWNGNRGAATWGNGTIGVTGTVDASNSLVGSSAGDQVGSTGTGALTNGNYVVCSPLWNSNRGAITWGNGTIGIRGTVDASNSLVGSNPGDFVGFVTSLSNGAYVVFSPSWNGNRGAVTWVNGSTGQTLDGNHTITPQNSLLGTAANAGLGFFVLENPTAQTFLALFATEAVARIAVGLVDPSRLPYAFAQGQTLTITPTFLTRTLNTGTAVVLQASNDITVNSPITVSAGGSGGALTLQAGRSILLNASITTDNGDLTLIANDQLANGVVDSQRDRGKAVITMASGTTLNTGSGTLTIELRDGAGLTEADSGAITLQMITAGSLSVANYGPSAGSDLILGSVTTSGAQSYSNANGTARVTANLAAGGNTISFTDAVALSAGVTLGTGSDTISILGGTVAPDPGLVTVAGSLALSSAATLRVTLNGTGTSSYSQIVASGPIDLGGSTLSLSLGFTPQVGDSFTLLTSNDPAGITGTFAGLDEGAIFDQDGMQFQITYQGGPGGKSVVLKRVG
jgi:hypothetical protein